MLYFYRFGKTPNLSLAEIKAWYKKSGKSFELISTRLSGVIIETDIEAPIAELGGIIKKGIVLDTIANLDEVKNLVVNDLALKEGRKVFGISDFSGKFSAKQIEKLGLTIKNEFDSGRFVTSRDPELSSVIVTKEKLLTKGGDYLIYPSNDEIYLIKTLEVQDFKSYDNRDYNRPRFDPKSGMLPLKLCQMMINIAGVDKDAKIIDPFCGSGTLIQEALVMGYKNLIGSDLSDKAVDDTKVNIEWLKTEYGINTDGVQIFHLRVKDIRNEVRDLDAVVTEPFLGPALTGQEPREKIIKSRDTVGYILNEAFETYSQILKPGGKIVTVVPCFKFKHETYSIDIATIAANHGLRIETNFEDLEQKGNRYPLVYARENQHLNREIFVLTKES